MRIRMSGLFRGGGGAGAANLGVDGAVGGPLGVPVCSTEPCTECFAVSDPTGVADILGGGGGGGETLCVRDAGAGGFNTTLPLWILSSGGDSCPFGTLETLTLGTFIVCFAPAVKCFGLAGRIGAGFFSVGT